ncbi:MAG: VOC family protein [Geminicoccaceae bacterium]|nr:VOC family protein [Geminicoccaceae bacterium]
MARASDRLFLGIDHTAIVVEDTEASLAFWRDRLGFEVAGESLNHGPEQERLNNVEGARLRITALRAPEGPGVELLEYLAPGDGRPSPIDSSASDLWHWQINLKVGDIGGLAGAFPRHRLISRAETELPDDQLGFTSGLIGRDPDGHAVLLTERLATLRQEAATW